MGFLGCSSICQNGFIGRACCITHPPPLPPPPPPPGWAPALLMTRCGMKAPLVDQHWTVVIPCIYMLIIQRFIACHSPYEEGMHASEWSPRFKLGWCGMQVGAFLQAGLAGAGAQCSSVCANPFTPATVGPVLNRSSAAKAAVRVSSLARQNIHQDSPDNICQRPWTVQ